MASKKARRMIAKLKREANNPNGYYSNIQKNAAKMSRKMTWPEREFKKLLKELKIEFETQKIVGSKIFDFYIPKVNLLVEIDGDYYHANPEIIKEEDRNRMQAKNVRNDIFKDALAEGLGYGIERVWENDLKNHYSVVKNRFKKLLEA